jgi:hypothetical protein
MKRLRRISLLVLGLFVGSQVLAQVMIDWPKIHLLLWVWYFNNLGG